MFHVKMEKLLDGVIKSISSNKQVWAILVLVS